MSLVAVTGIRKEYRNKVVLADVSLQVERGERVALVGPNGAGKTTLLKIIMGQEVQDQGQVFLSKKIKVGYLSQYLTDLDVSEDNALHLESLHRLELKMRDLELAMAENPAHAEDLLVQYQKEMISKLRKYKKIKQSQSREKALKKFEEKAAENLLHLKSSENLEKMQGPKLRFNDFDHISHEVMSCHHLHKAFGDQVLFNDLSLTIYGGEKVAIIGPNGCGKTTLINMILGKDQDFEGQMKFGAWVDYAYIGQEVYFDDEDLSMIDYMTQDKVDDKEARRRLSHFQFYGDVVNTKIRDLSGGERVRLTLAMILLQAPHCLILDEPTNHLDLESRIAIENALKHFRGTVIAISHDRYFLNQCINRIVSVENHNVVTYKGQYDDFKLSHMVLPKSKEARDKKRLSLEKELNLIEGIPAGDMTDADYERYDRLIEAIEKLKVS